MTRKTSGTRASVCLLGLVLFLSGAAYSQTLEQRVDRYISSFPPHDAFSGVILAAVGDKILLHKGYGQASREFSVPNGPDTKFQVGSISKAFTAILALKLADKGLLDLDSPIGKYLPEYPAENGVKITIRHLLSHTSGIPHHIDAIPDYWLSHDKAFHTPGELWKMFAGVPLAHAPGEKITYSSPGFYVLGALLQRLAQKSYAELLREMVFDPLGLNDSRVENNRTVSKGTAVGYMRGLSGLIRAGFEDKSTALAAGDLLTTAHDLYLWDRGLKAEPGRILSAASKALLYQPIKAGEMFTFGGPVLQIPYEDGKKTLTLNRLSGSSSGYMAAMDRIIAPDACVVILSNVQDADTGTMVDDISDFLLRHVLGIAAGHPAPPTVALPPAAEVAPSDLGKVLGFYRSPGGSILGVVMDGGKIYQLPYGGGSVSRPILEMVPQGADSFQLGRLSAFTCRYSSGGESGKPTLEAFVQDRSRGKAVKMEARDIDSSAYGGFFESVELQKTFRFIAGPKGLTAERFLGGEDVPLVFLEKDLFGWRRGFLRFTRSADGGISGFILMTKDTDTFFGSRFVKL